MTEPQNTIISTSASGSKEPELSQKTCSCCCETFTKSNRAPVQCPNGKCVFIACKECVRTYLLSTTEAPHCMSCKTAWNERFMVSKLNQSFVNKDYKKHRKALMLERQISMIPETMPALERHQQRIEYENLEKEMRERIREHRNAIENLREQIGEAYRNFHHGVPGQEKEVKKFIMPCPDEECRGWLSTAYKCEVCHTYACPKCLVQTGKERLDPSHVCDEELVKTASLIRESTKPCPNCGERIMKASGCDQMYCTSCHTAFSWRTGKIDTGVIHNPHFFQYQQAQGGGVIRNPGDELCGGLPNRWWSIRNTMRNILNNSKLVENEVCCACKEHAQNNYQNSGTEKNVCERQYHLDLIGKFTELFHFLRHVNHHELRTLREQVRNLNDHENLRLRYLMKEITKEALANEVMKRDKRRRKIIEILHIYELIAVVGNDLVNHISQYIQEISNEKNNYFLLCSEMTKKFKEFDGFVDYVNNQFKLISVTYSQIVIQINKDDYTNFKHKFKMSDIETFA